MRCIRRQQVKPFKAHFATPECSSWNIVWGGEVSASLEGERLSQARCGCLEDAPHVWTCKGTLWHGVGQVFAIPFKLAWRGPYGPGSRRCSAHKVYLMRENYLLKSKNYWHVNLTLEVTEMGCGLGFVGVAQWFVTWPPDLPWSRGGIRSN